MNKQLPIFLLVLIVFWHCDNLNEKIDSEPPQVTIINPVDGQIISDSVHVLIEANDNTAVSKVELFVNNNLVSTLYTEPYETDIYVSDDLGFVIDLFAKARDTENNIAYSDTIHLQNFQWFTLYSDANEDIYMNITDIYLRYSDNLLEFRVEYNHAWEIYNMGTHAIDLGLFIDIDQNQSTGYIDQLGYTVNDIGADYVIIAGLEGDSLWTWSENDTSWIAISPLEYVLAENNMNYIELGINMSLLENANTFNLVIANIFFDNDSAVFDWAPDDGHMILDMGQIGNTTIGQDRNMVPSINRNKFNKKKNIKFLK